MRNKLIMIAAMLAVMVSMTGIAGATNVNIDTSTPYGTPDIILNSLDGTTVTLTDVRLESISGAAGSRDLMVVSSDPNLYIRVNNSSLALDTGFANNVAITKTWTYTGSPAFRTFNLEVKGTVAGTVTVYDMKSGVIIGQAGVNAASADVSDIPEFPTVALPVASVIGLVFFLQNRKNKKE
jgi:hypothetical protein